MMDFSTLNLAALKKLQTWDAPRHLHLQEGSGNGCYMDPPGYPSYFTRNVYTSDGNTPRHGASQVIQVDDTFYVVDKEEWFPYEAKVKCLRDLWAPLPLEHERVQLWMQNVYRHMAHCYADDAGSVTETMDNGMFIWPVPDYKRRHFHDDHRFSDTWRVMEKAAVDAYNEDLVARCLVLAIPTNHKAHRTIVGFYPEAKPVQEWINNPPQDSTQWWETEATRPTPATCRPRSCGPHPVNGTWCQWCGWIE
jgi:hypothetical protein